MNFYWILWIFSALVALVPVYYFLIGLNDGSITSRNILMWVALLLIVFLVLGGSWFLQANGHLGFAKGLLFIIVIPGVIGLLYILTVIFSKQRWN